KTESAQGALDRARGMIPQNGYESLHIALLSESGEHDALVQLLEQRADYGGAAAQHDIMRAVYNVAYQKRDYPLAQRLVESYVSRCGSDVGVVQCQITVAFGVRDWATA